jgi:hypothetical protein
VAELAEAAGLSVQRIGAALIGRQQQAAPERGNAAGLAALAAEVETLKDVRHRTVLSLRFGLDGSGEQTHEAIAQQLNLSRARIQQLEQAALALLARRPAVHALRSAYAEADHARELARPTRVPKKRTST